MRRTRSIPAPFAGAVILASALAACSGDSARGTGALGGTGAPVDGGNAGAPVDAGLAAAADSGTAAPLDDGGSAAPSADGGTGAPASDAGGSPEDGGSSASLDAGTAPAITSLSVTPAAVSLAPSAWQQFSAEVTGRGDLSVRWSVAEGNAGGTVDSNGRYLAPHEPGLYHVRALSNADPSKSAAAEVRVASPPSLSLECAPAPLRLPAGATSTASCVVTSAGGFSGAVRFTGKDLPAGVALAQLDPVTLAPGARATAFLTVTALQGTTAGAYATSAVTASAGASISSTAPLPITLTASAPRVRMIDLVPSDRTFDARVAAGMERAIRHLQIFYGTQLGGGASFVVHAPVVEVLQSQKPASWFEEDIWGRTTSETFALTGGRFYDTDNVWAVFVDARLLPGQTAGGAPGVAVLHRGDLLGISGEDTQGLGVCRWVGGLGHEIGHAFGLPHPPGCDAHQPDCDSQVLMYLGYLSYPKTTLNAAEVSQLRGTPFFTSGATATSSLFDCSAVP